jgi:putative colanic acid biosynthesis acetyltransferase WcaF
VQAAVTVDLSRFENSFYDPGSSWIVRTIWFTFGHPLLRCAILPSSGFRRRLLRLFGADVGDNVTLKPGFRVKYPWNFKTGKNCWLGEDAWIDNLAPVTLGDNVCISQGAYLCTGSHDWTDPAFRLIVKPISIHDGAWVGARASLAPGVTVGACAIVGFGAVATKSIPPFEIHAGNPAAFHRSREIKGRPDAKG